MTNTKFRKRALLSSVAMLLVALVAMGSATFAWFVADPTAKADGLQMKTTTSTGLVIDVQYDGNTTFTHDEDLNVLSANGGSSPYTSVVTMSPASMSETNKMRTVEAAASTGYIGKSGATISTLTDATTYYAETIDCKTTDGAAATITKAKVTFTEATGAPTIKSAFRVALLDGNTILATWAPSSGTGRYISDTVAAGTYPSSALTDTRTLSGSGTQETISVAIAADSTKTLTLVAYLDGEDGNCYSDLASLATCFSNVELWLSL